MTRKLFIPVLFLCVLIAQPAHAVMLRLPVETLAAKADTIVRGLVLDTQCVDGKKKGDIDTIVTIRVEERLKGSAPQTFELTVPGGSIDGRFMFITDHADFAPLQEVVVFLDSGLTRVVGQIQGKLTIEDGVVKETMQDSERYLASLRRVVSGRTALIDMNKDFSPVSNIEGYMARMIRPKYGYDGMHWSQNSVGVTINENCSDTSGEGAAVQAAMETWTDTPAYFTFDYDGTNHVTSYSQDYENEAFWGNGSAGEAIAYATIWGYSDTEIAECDLTFLNEYSWSAQGDPASYEMDVQNIATHEFGHFLMLLDLYSSSDSDKTMYGYASQGETYKRTLTQDDINGIVAIYGGSTDDDTDDDSDDDDDDWHDDDSDDDDDDDATDTCSEVLLLIYTDCNLSFLDGGDSVSGSDAYNMCEEGGDPWPCIFDCAQSEYVGSCSDLAWCLNDNCSVVTADEGGGSGDDDDDSSGFCG